MTAILAGLAPVFAVILTGFVIRRLRVVANTFWFSAETLTFYVFFPALLVVNTARAELSDPDIAGMSAAVVVGIVCVTALVLLVRRWLTVDGPTLSSAVQSAVRPNVYIAMATAAALFGSDGLSLMSLCIAIAVPLVNLISVVALLMLAAPPRQRLTPGAVIVSVFSNPLIGACLLGLAINGSGLSIPVPVESFLKILSGASLAIGLLAVGAGLDLSAAAGTRTVVAVACTFKLLVLPAIVAVVGWMLGVTGIAMSVLVLFASLPVSASAYVMARQMGGNAPMMAGTITLTTVASAATMPALLAVAV